MQVIGAGLLRTGTLSMKTAMETLGFPCYHMIELLKNKGHVGIWDKFMYGQGTIDWDKIFQNFEATMDVPASFYYKELMQKFPEAKVVLTIRDPKRWYTSFSKLYNVINELRTRGKTIPELAEFIELADDLLKNTFGDPTNADKCIKVFNEHNAEVQRFVPKQRLLVFEVKEGWEPLCNFLGCAIPDKIPFPHKNSGEAARDLVENALHELGY